MNFPLRTPSIARGQHIANTQPDRRPVRCTASNIEERSMHTTSVNWMGCVGVALLCILQGCSKDETSRGPDAAGAQIQDSAAPTDTAGAGPTTDAAQTAAADAAPTGGTAGAAAGDPGAQTFQTYCQTCHGPSGKGDGPAAAGLNPKPASFADGQFKFDPNGNGAKGEIDDIRAVVRDGAAKYGGSPLMAPWPSLSPEQLQGVAQHVKSLAGAQ
jgi:cytochrome c553